MPALNEYTALAKTGQPRFAGADEEALSDHDKAGNGVKAPASRPIKSPWPCSVTLARCERSKMRGMH